jgi:hypothetical protein
MRGTYHVAQVTPLVQEVAVDIDAVGFREVLGDQLPDGGQIRLLLGPVVLHILQGGGVPFLRIRVVAHWGLQGGGLAGWSGWRRVKLSAHSDAMTQPKPPFRAHAAFTCALT